LTVLFFGSCKSTPDLTEDEVYTILNGIIADDSCIPLTNPIFSNNIRVKIFA
jgi:hypothetical protein